MVGYLILVFVCAYIAGILTGMNIIRRNIRWWIAEAMKEDKP